MESCAQLSSMRIIEHWLLISWPCSYCCKPKPSKIFYFDKRSTTKTTTNVTLYRMVCGQDPVIPIKLEFSTWRILPWDKVHTTADLLALKARQLEKKDWRFRGSNLTPAKGKNRGKRIILISESILSKAIALWRDQWIQSSQRHLHFEGTGWYSTVRDYCREQAEEIFPLPRKRGQTWA